VHRIVGSLLLITCLTSTAHAQDLAADVRRAEEQLAEALINKDAAAFDLLLAPAFVLRGAPDVPRAAWISNALSMCWGHRYEISDFVIVRSEADTIIASLVLTTTVDPVSCASATVRSLLTDVWIRQDGRLRLALRHSGGAGDVSKQFSTEPAPPPRWERTTEISAVSTGGNTDTHTLGAGASFIWRPSTWETRGRVAFVRSESDDVTTAESLVAELRQARTISPRLQLFGRADYLINRFAGIDYRLTVDGGLAWTVRDTPRGSLAVDGGLGVTREERLAGSDQTFGAGTVGLLAKWLPTATTQVEDRVVFSTDLGSFGNWRMHNTVSVTVAMTRVLSVRFSHDLKHTARPVIGFGKNDTIAAAALVARF
jgi:putative salt-induced outer membrane protein YdiY